jgi:type III pantothenate kinase
MKPSVVVDVGNSRIKWGLCGADVVRAVCSLPADDAGAWQEQRRRWELNDRCQWVVTGVHPSRRERLTDWLRQNGQDVKVLDDPRDLPLRVLIARPDYVGVDRLLDAVAANSRRSVGVPAVIIDAGSAVTVDLVDGSGAFAGGAILPGMRLMAKALHDYTAAMELGIFWAVAGGIEALVREYRNRRASSMEVFLTGGDGPLLHSVLPEAILWPEMTLEGIRLSAEALP